MLDTQQSTCDIGFDGNITVRIPITITRKSGRRFIMTPQGKELEYQSPKPSNPMIAAIVKAHHWQEQLETGKVASLKEIAHNEKITDGYVSRVYRLTLLAPDIITAILSGTQPKTLCLLDLLKPFPLIWTEQREMWTLFNTVQDR